VASDKKEFPRKKYKIEELYEKKWILREMGSGTREIFRQFLGNHFTKLNIFMTLGHTEAIKRIVSKSEGLCCLSRLAVQKELDEGTLFEIHVEGMSFERDLLQLIYKDKYQSLLLREFIKFAASYVQENAGK
jgi:DNA-binding transcriptional LysR family regulator